MMNPEISIQFFYHIIKNGSVILSNLPKELLPEVDTCLAESKLLSCKVRGVLKRQKKLPIEDFLREQGRFKHLFKKGNEDLIAQFQAEVDRRWEDLQYKCAR